jgi:hypothetical protein
MVSDIAKKYTTIKFYSVKVVLNAAGIINLPVMKKKDLTGKIQRLIFIR